MSEKPVKTDQEQGKDGSVSLKAASAKREAFLRACAFALFEAVKSVYPTSRLGESGLTKDGFYADIDFTTPISATDLATVEKEMFAVLKADYPTEKITLTKGEAEVLMNQFSEPYRMRILEERFGDTVELYRHGGFTDVSFGEQALSTEKIRAVKLTHMSGAYFLGDRQNKMLTRIYGVAFSTKAELGEYLKKREDLLGRDHTRVGRELGYFATFEGAGQGLPTLLPKGAKVTRLLTRLTEDLAEAKGYRFIQSPPIMRAEFSKADSSAKKPRAVMLKGKRGAKDEYVLKNGTEAFHYAEYARKPRSYKDLPYRVAETSFFITQAESGDLRGLTRTRGYTETVAHVFCGEDGIKSAFKEYLSFVKAVLKATGLTGVAEFTLAMQERRRGAANAKKYAACREAAIAAMEEEGLPFTDLTESGNPFSLNVTVKDVYGRADVLFYARPDFQTPSQYKAVYTGKDGEAFTPCAIEEKLGAYERLLAHLLEKDGGALPFWLSPVQARLLPVTERSENACREFAAALISAGVRAETDERRLKIEKKIRDGELEKIPYLLIVGDREEERGTVSVREYGKGNHGEEVAEDLLAKLAVLDKIKQA